MAKKKRHVVRHRTRRVSGISANVPEFAGIAVGAIAARLLATKFMASLDPKISAGVQLAAGVVLAGQKSPMVKGLGLGIFGAGVIAGGQSFGFIAGPSSYMQQGLDANAMPIISGSEDNSLNYLGNPQQSPELAVISGVDNHPLSADGTDRTDYYAALLLGDEA